MTQHALQQRLGNRKFFWLWFAAVNATLLVAMQWVGVIGLLALLIGFAGAFLFLFFAKWLAIRAHRIRVIEPELFRSDSERELHGIVADVAQRARLETAPAVGIYDSPEINAFATGARADALAARTVGHAPMIAALTTIAKDDAVIPRGQLGYVAFKIAGRSPRGELFSTHPSL